VEDYPEPIIRNYTPTSSNDDKGFFDLVIKVYPKGKMSQYMESLRVGVDSIEVAGPKGEFIYQPNQFRRLGMLAGGTGITPMLQVIREVLKHAPQDKTVMNLLYGNVTVQDIILREDLDSLTAKHKDQFTLYHVLNECPEGWTQGKGFITKELIQQHLPAPADDIKILLCGPPPMIKAMREHLSALGYEKKHIFSF
jgi:cytochrome-b5 reductase